MRHPAPLQEGRSGSSRVLGAGSDGRVGVHKTKRAGADGEIVWSWHPDAGVNPRVNSPGGRWLTSPDTGEITYKP